MTVLHSSVQVAETAVTRPADASLREREDTDNRTGRDAKAPHGTRKTPESENLIPPWSSRMRDGLDDLSQLLGRKLAENVTTGPVDECWEWQAARDTARYGVFRFAGKNIRAHRLALEFKLGRPLETGEWACHRCDNPPCCNPAHLYVGTAEENRWDAAERFRGATNSPAPTVVQLRIFRFVCDCRKRFGYPPSIREIGAAFGISSTNGVNDHLKALTRKGLLTPRSYGTARALVPTEAGLALLDERDRMPSLVDAVTGGAA